MSNEIKSCVFISNFLNHHQLPFCLEMFSVLGDGFSFIATEKINSERILMGYRDMNNDYLFVVKSYENDDGYDEAIKLCEESDIVIIGSAPEIFIEKRIKKNKLTFKYSERIFKKGKLGILDPRIIKYIYVNHFRYRSKRVFMLCAGGYAASDFALIGAYVNKCYKWGYFPEVKNYDVCELIASKKGEKLTILWVGRFLDWKHPEKALYVAAYLKKNNIDFILNIIGCGNMEEELKAIAELHKLKNCINFLGCLPADIVREYMEKSEIFLFTSDFNEGWGAVLNEAMNSSCAVVASHAIGSVPFLINDKINGLIYRNDSLTDLCEKVMMLVRNPEMRKCYGINAYTTIKMIWNPKEAALRLLSLTDKLLSNMEVKDLYLSGPCSLCD